MPEDWFTIACLVVLAVCAVTMWRLKVLDVRRARAEQDAMRRRLDALTGRDRT